MWCLETLEAINKEAGRRAMLGLPERDALFAVTDERFAEEEKRQEMERSFPKERRQIKVAV